MNRVTKISAWLAIWLFIASALAIFPGAAAAAQSGETPGIMQTVQYNEESEGPVYRGTLDIRIQSETGGSPPGSLCSPILPETRRVLRPRTSTCAIRLAAFITCG